jgi:hypothetical protein
MTYFDAIEVYTFTTVDFIQTTVTPDAWHAVRLNHKSLLLGPT